MCLAVIAYQSAKKWPLVIATNRDESHSRAAIPIGSWVDYPDIIAGRDMTGGGTWLGINKRGRIALLTNVREPGRHIPDAPTRGRLTEQFLLSHDSPSAHARLLQDEIHRYNGFNLLIGDVQELWYVSNRSSLSQQRLKPGVFGLSNAELQTPWPKLIKTREAVASHLASLSESDANPDHEVLFKIMSDRQTPPDEQLPATGISIARERMLASPFITSDDYGTRCTTIIMFRQDGVVLMFERTFNAQGDSTGTVKCQVDTHQKSFTKC